MRVGGFRIPPRVDQLPHPLRRDYPPYQAVRCRKAGCGQSSPSPCSPRSSPTPSIPITALKRRTRTLPRLREAGSGDGHGVPRAPYPWSTIPPLYPSRLDQVCHLHPLSIADNHLAPIAAFGAEIRDPILGYVIPFSSFTTPCPSNDTTLTPVPNTGCPDLCLSGPHKPADTWIALVQRGQCEFVKKVREAQRFGAKAVVVGGEDPELTGHPDTLVNMYSPGSSLILTFRERPNPYLDYRGLFGCQDSRDLYQILRLFTSLLHDRVFKHVPFWTQHSFSTHHCRILSMGVVFVSIELILWASTDHSLSMQTYCHFCHHPPAPVRLDFYHAPCPPHPCRTRSATRPCPRKHRPQPSVARLDRNPSRKARRPREHRRPSNQSG